MLGGMIRIHETLRAARRSVGMTQQQVANAAGISVRSVVDLESGKGGMGAFQAAAKVVELRLSEIGIGQSLGEQVRNARLRRRWSRCDVAQRSGLDRDTVASVEADRANLSSLTKVLSVVAPTVRRRARDRAYWSSDTSGQRDLRFTPPEFLGKIVAAFGRIDLDPCANSEAYVPARRHIYEHEDGLRATWSGEIAFCNPPYSQLLKWIKRTHRAWQDGEVRTAIALIPVRTDSGAFHELVFGTADLLLLKGRLKFIEPGGRKGHPTPFSLMLAIWGASNDNIKRLCEQIDGVLLPGSSRRSFADEQLE